MTVRVEVHPAAPQRRLIGECADVLRAGGVLAYPTDTCYALGCAMNSANGVKTIQRIRQTGKDHELSLICRDLSEIATYARVPNWAYRLLKAHTPGPYTFILAATRDVPRRLQNSKRKTVGIRVPDNPVTAALVEQLGDPMLSTTLQLPGDDLPLNDGFEIQERLAGQVDMVVDAGSCGIEPSTVVDLTGSNPVVLRVGKGDPEHFESRRSL
jgi:tRNA threonylcarbamoyl adenosine modification protein (Sua5/YciO/YrdC/YwlC family)